MAESYENGYAVVIGVDQNQLPRLELPTVASDVQAVYDVLIHPQRCAYKEDNVRFLKGAESTNRNIMDALSWLREKANAQPDATAIVYYSGHGMVDKPTQQYYLIPYDIPSMQRVRANAIRAELFNAEIADITAQRLLVVLDCCHAGGLDTKAVEEIGDEDANYQRRPFPLELPETKSIPPFEEGAKSIHELSEGEGRAILNSSQGSQYSYIRTDGKMSLFTYHLIEALTGHAAHHEEDSTVLVTDVMSYVTREVAKSAAAQNRDQTPVMRTTGVFPVALLLGGEGLSKGVSAPDPLEPLPPAAGVTTTFNQEGQTVGGQQVNIGQQQGDIGQIGNNINTGGGDYAGRDHIVQGDQVAGDKFGGDKVGGNKIEGGQYNVGTVNAENFALGQNATVTQTNYGISGQELEQLFTPLLQQVGQSAGTEALAKAQQLKAEAAKGEQADDERLAGLIQDVVDLAPSAVETVIGLFTSSALAKVGGVATRFVLGRLKRQT